MVLSKRNYAAAIRTLYFKYYKICPLNNMLINYTKLINYNRSQDFYQMAKQQQHEVIE